MNPNDLGHKLMLPTIAREDAHTMLGVLGSVAVLIGHAKDFTAAAWFDGYDADGEKADAVHVRAILAGGVITLDYEFSFDGAPDARLLPWSRVRALRVIAGRSKQTTIANAWLETDDGQNIEFAGVANHQGFAEIVSAVRNFLQ